MPRRVLLDTEGFWARAKNSASIVAPHAALTREAGVGGPNALAPSVSARAFEGARRPACSRLGFLGRFSGRKPKQVLARLQLAGVLVAQAVTQPPDCFTRRWVARTALFVVIAAVVRDP